jgi:hypothetical protein
MGDVGVCDAVNHPTAPRFWQVGLKYDPIHLYCWAPIGTRGGHRMVVNTAQRRRNEFVASFIHSVRYWDEAVTRGHSRVWKDGCPRAPVEEKAGQPASFKAYYSVQYDKKESTYKHGPTGRNKGQPNSGVKGFQWFQVKPNSPILWFDGVDDGLVFRGVGTVSEVRVAKGDRLDLTDKRTVRNLKYTFVTFDMFTDAETIRAAWIYALREQSDLAGNFSPSGWSRWIQTLGSQENTNRRQQAVPQRSANRNDPALINYPASEENPGGIDYIEFADVLEGGRRRRRGGGAPRLAGARAQSRSRSVARSRSRTRSRSIPPPSRSEESRARSRERRREREEREEREFRERMARPGPMEIENMALYKSRSKRRGYHHQKSHSRSQSHSRSRSR